MTVARRRQQPAAAARRTRKRPPVRRGLRVLGAVSLGILTASGIGHAVLGHMDDRLARVDAFAGMKNRPSPTKGTNFLLVGTDVRRGLSQSQRTGLRLGGEPCDCTDTMMLAHLSRDGRRVSVVALPRDSYAELPRAGKLKWAWGVGGPALAVSTVEKMTGVKVDHYAEFDFGSFMKTVDRIGGVDLCFARPLRDPVTGLDLPAGTVRADGGTALRYVRSGHLPGSPDLQRMQNQQRFLAALVRRVTDIGLLQNPVKLDQVAKAALGSVRADRQTKPDDLIALATGLRGGFGARSVEFATVPVDATPFRVQGVGTTLRWDVKGAQRIFEALREDRPLTGPDGGPLATPSPSAPEPAQVEVPPKSIRVQVNNGTTVNGLGARVDKELRRLGFRTTGTPGNTVRHDAEYTVIHYDPGWDRSAKALGTALPYAELRRVSGLGPTLRITVGADYDGVTPVRAGEPDPPAAPPVGLQPMRGDRILCG
ncbi:MULTISPECIES: LCP family protein [unclassified Streptomyces]|uniref:LCP family protein n=1 Tax=unclassified Streptomyces TaxID=2593676 RepID=UPI0003A6625C|nr:MULTISPECIES: LCP family protein [unclassified Streptomyces]MYX37294.1 LytR family transcriptional regulator [Streptomyces sp. SID8377]